MSKPTIGEVVADGRNIYELVLHRGRNGHLQEVNRWWAYLQTQHGLMTEQELEAKAKRMAASDDMVEALKAALTYIYTNHVTYLPISATQEENLRIQAAAREAIRNNIIEKALAKAGEEV